MSSEKFLNSTDKLRLVIVSNAQPRLVWRLAERLRNEVSGAGICGIVYVRNEAKARTSPAGIARAMLRQLGQAFMNLIHACPTMPNQMAFKEEQLAQQGSAAGCQVLSVSNLSSIRDFINNCAADLCVVLGDLDVGDRLGQSFRLGAIVAVVPQSHFENFLNREDEDRAIPIRILRISNGSVQQDAALSTKIPVELYDTTTSLLLKANVVAMDLAIEATRIASATLNNADDRPLADCADLLSYLSYWRGRRHPSPELYSPPSYTRPLWRLCLAQALLLPYVFARNWYRRLRRRFPITILVHHLVSDVPHRLGMPTDVLCREIEFLKQHYRIVSLSEAVRLLRSGTVSEPTVVLTFDDGYQENFITLRAVLEATGVPITMFICTEIVSAQSHFPHDDQHCRHSDFVSLSWNQVAHLQAIGAEIGSHTRSHFDCGLPGSGVLEEEIMGSQNDLESRLNTPARFFAFPYGKRDNISPQAIEIAVSSYDYFLSSYSGDNLPEFGFKQRELMRKGLPHNCWELELTLQSVLDLRVTIKEALQRKRKNLHSLEVNPTRHSDQQGSLLQQQ